MSMPPKSSFLSRKNDFICEVCSWFYWTLCDILRTIRPWVSWLFYSMPANSFNLSLLNFLEHLLLSLLLLLLLFFSLFLFLVDYLKKFLVKKFKGKKKGELDALRRCLRNGFLLEKETCWFWDGNNLF